MTFAQRWNRLTTHFSERIPVVKRSISVMTIHCATQKKNKYKLCGENTEFIGFALISTAVNWWIYFAKRLTRNETASESKLSSRQDHTHTHTQTNTHTHIFLQYVYADTMQVPLTPTSSSQEFETRKHVPQTRRKFFTRLHGITAQTTDSFPLNATKVAGAIFPAHNSRLS